MKILHLCLACFYIDNFAYQENILPRFHKKLGHEVQIIASTQTYLDNKVMGEIAPSEYVNEDGITVIRLPYRFHFLKMERKLRKYKGVYEHIADFAPDVIFIHDLQFLDMKELIRYKKDNPLVRMIADGHADYINSAKTFVSRNVLHGIIYKNAIKKAIPYIESFYGTLPCRCVFMKEVYGIPETKLTYLPFGVDDELLDIVERENARDKVRKEYGIGANEFVLVTGGKINRSKQDTLLLMNAVNNSTLPIRLLIFGSITEDIKEEFDSLLDSERIIYAGWANEKKSYELMTAAEVAVFPCLHSTLWEQAVGTGLPCIIHYIEGYTHINLADNCVLMHDITEKKIGEAIQILYDDYSRYKNNAMKCKEAFSYRKIAESVL